MDTSPSVKLESSLTGLWRSSPLFDLSQIQPNQPHEEHSCRVHRAPLPPTHSEDSTTRSYNVGNPNPSPGHSPRLLLPRLPRHPVPLPLLPFQARVIERCCEHYHSLGGTVHDETQTPPRIEVLPIRLRSRSHGGGGLSPRLRHARRGHDDVRCPRHHRRHHLRDLGGAQIDLEGGGVLFVSLLPIPRRVQELSVMGGRSGDGRVRGEHQPVHNWRLRR